jgi:putative nucleotidyltransferase with HDIG domain
MRGIGMLGVLLPEVEGMRGVTQNRHHRLDVYDHSLAALDFMAEDPADDPVLRLAALLHDAGKPAARTIRKGEPSFIGHEVIGARMVEACARRLRLPEADVGRLCHLVRHHLVRYTPRWSDRAVRRFVRRVGPARLEDLLRLCTADARAKDPGTHRDVPVPPEVAALRARIDELSAGGMAVRVRDLAITGEDVIGILGISPGPEVGRVLEALLERVITDPSLNRRDPLLKTLRAMRERGETRT